MRTLGVVILGIFAGLIAGFLVFDELLGRLVVAGGPGVEPPWAFLIGFGPMAAAIAGAVVAVLIDHRVRGRRGPS